MSALFEDPDFKAGQILGDIWTERVRQQELWGDQTHKSDGEWMIILMEEIGEAAKEIYEKHSEDANVELVQCAAVIVNWLEARKTR